MVTNHSELMQRNFYNKLIFLTISLLLSCEIKDHKKNDYIGMNSFIKNDTIKNNVDIVRFIKDDTTLKRCIKLNVNSYTKKKSILAFINQPIIDSLIKSYSKYETDSAHFPCKGIIKIQFGKCSTENIRLYISYIINRSESLECPCSLYTIKQDSTAIFIYNEEIGFFKRGNYPKELMKIINYYLYDNISVHYYIYKDKVTATSEINPLINYEPCVWQLNIKKNEIKIKTGFSYDFKDYTFPSCKELENTYEIVDTIYEKVSFY